MSFRPAHPEGSSPHVPSVLAATRTKSSIALHRRYGTNPYPRLLREPTSSSQCETGDLSALTGNVTLAAPAHDTTTDTSVQAAQPLPTELKTVLERRKLQALTPYKPQAWESLLFTTNLVNKYPSLSQNLRTGFFLNFPIIKTTQSPPNKSSISDLQDKFDDAIQLEITKQRYLGPLSRQDVESLIGPFQSSPFSIIPKPGRPDCYRILQNYSYPYNTSPSHPNPSINSFIDSDDFPTTWGTFSVISLLIHQLPPNSQIATRDVSEAYRTVPLHHSQWPGAVARTGPDSFCIDTATCFGSSPSAGIYGVVADAGADIFRSQGIGPLAKWVDDHVFFRILRTHLSKYNQQRKDRYLELSAKKQNQDGGRLWYGGNFFPDGTLDEHVEDCEFPCADLSSLSPRSHEDSLYSYNFEDIDRISDALGIPWEKSKDLPFASSTSYIGLHWDLNSLTVSLSLEKREKYIKSIDEWFSQPRHNLNDVQKLYGRLLHACLVVTSGRAYLTSLEAMLALCNTHPYISYIPTKATADDLSWWIARLSSSSVSRPIPSPVTLLDPEAFSDACLTGIAITIRGKWRAWRLIPGWQTLEGSRDIGWAEAVGFELLVRAVSRFNGSSRHFRVYGDNKGVVEGWRNYRSKSKPTNQVFRRIHSFLDQFDHSLSVHPAYVPSESNPADPPSRGIFPPFELQLPEIPLPVDLNRFIIDATLPFSTTELCLFREGRHPSTLSERIDNPIDDSCSINWDLPPAFDESNHHSRYHFRSS